MKWFMTILSSVIFSVSVALPGQVLAASITETKAAIGKDCVASGSYSTAMGNNTTAIASVSTAMGFFTTASGLNSTAMGYHTTASVENSTAMGNSTTASGDNSTAMGNSTIASGFVSTAMGSNTTASGNYSTAMGNSTTANGDYSTAMGLSTTAYSAYETVIGTYPNSYSPASTTEWNSSDRLFVIGNGYGSLDRSNAMVVLKNGNIGIGTSNPTNILELSSSNPRLYFNRESSVSDFSGLYWRSSNDNFEGAFVRNNNSGDMELYTNGTGGTPRMVIIDSGNIGINTTIPNYRLEVNGSAGKPGGGSWSNSSDERLKDVKGEYKPGLEEIALLRPVAFYYKTDNSRGLPSDEEYIGFIAQEVQEVFPEAVSEGPDGYLDFNMHPVNVAVVNAIKELKAENDSLKAENASLKRDIEKIKAIMGI
jgi:hypothetical protein